MDVATYFECSDKNGGNLTNKGKRLTIYYLFSDSFYPPNISQMMLILQDFLKLFRSI